MRRILRRDHARADLVTHYAYLAERSLATADRFFTEAESSLRMLAENPFLGGAYPTENPHLERLRCYRVSRRFRRYLVFYLPLEDGIDVVRVLHGSQAVDAILKLD